MRGVFLRAWVEFVRIHHKTSNLIESNQSKPNPIDLIESGPNMLLSGDFSSQAPFPDILYSFMTRRLCRYGFSAGKYVMRVSEMWLYHKIEA